MSTTTLRKDVKTGGDWLFTMHGPDGKDYPNYVKFGEVVPGARLEYEHGAVADQPPMFRVVVSFSELNNKTKMNFRMIFSSSEEADEKRKFIRSVGGDSTWDRLAEYLELQNSGRDVFVINRVFEIDIARMYQVWTKPEHLMEWTAPAGFKGRYLSANIHAGGESFYEMTGNGLTMYGKAKYLELLEPDRLVYTQIFADRNGEVTRHPMAPTWPECLKTTVCLYGEAAMQTRIELQWEVFGEATEQERATFGAAKNGMAHGWTGSFDKLEAYLSVVFSTLSQNKASIATGMM